MTFDPYFYLNFGKLDSQTLSSSIEGGITIALAASLYYAFYGCILGMSGLVGTIIRGDLNYQARRAFTILCGLVFSSSVIYHMNTEQLTTFQPFDSKVLGSNTHLVLAGLLVGLGTQLGSGCTSGHGLCGLPRLSPRSIAAVMIFLMTGFITATFNVRKQVPIFLQVQRISTPSNIQPIYFILATTILPVVVYFFSVQKSFGKFFRSIIYFLIGSIFGFGLMLAGMSKRGKIYGFLQLNSKWDPSLIVVLMSGVIVNLIIFTVMRKGIKKPIFQDKLSDPQGQIDWKIVTGSVLFGIGWGIGGLCPGPFLLLLPLQNLRIPIFWGIPFIIGMKAMQIINRPALQLKFQGKVKIN